MHAQDHRRCALRSRRRRSQCQRGFRRRGQGSARNRTANAGRGCGNSHRGSGTLELDLLLLWPQRHDHRTGADRLPRAVTWPERAQWWPPGTPGSRNLRRRLQPGRIRPARRQPREMGWPWLLLSGWGQLGTPAVLPTACSTDTNGKPLQLRCRQARARVTARSLPRLPSLPPRLPTEGLPKSGPRRVEREGRRIN